MTIFKFSVGDVCIFTNKGASWVTSNDGKRCRIVRTKDPESDEWKELIDEPGYVIEFLDDSNNGFGCRESELEQVT